VTAASWLRVNAPTATARLWVIDPGSSAKYLERPACHSLSRSFRDALPDTRPGSPGSPLTSGEHRAIVLKRNRFGVPPTRSTADPLERWFVAMSLTHASPVEVDG
jgi:hypothetical protein